MEITISEFRKNIKKYFDLAVSGEAVCIDRGGMHYNLKARIPDKGVIPMTAESDVIPMADEPIEGMRIPPMQQIVVSKDLANKIKKTPPGGLARFEGPICKVHGFPLDSRGKCLQKGCEYA